MSAVVAALQAALAAEHAAIYAYGVAGARLDPARRAQARSAYDAHRARRDRLQALLREQGASPSPAAPEYTLPSPPTGADTAAALAATVEDGVAAAYADLVAVASGSLRREAALALQQDAVRAAAWRGRTEPFPGLTGRIDLTG